MAVVSMLSRLAITLFPYHKLLWFHLKKLFTKSNERYQAKPDNSGTGEIVFFFLQAIKVIVLFDSVKYTGDSWLQDMSSVSMFNGTATVGSISSVCMAMNATYSQTTGVKLAYILLAMDFDFSHL